MRNRKIRMCRLCLSKTAILRSIFTIFRNHNLVFIIRDFVKLEIREDDELPKLICKSCAVKLIRVRENVTLFIDSDRKLRDKLQNDTELPDVDELRQVKRRKYNRREVDSDFETEEEHSDDEEELVEVSIKKEESECKDLALSSDKDLKVNLFEFNEVKEEVLDSDAEEDLPLTAFRKTIIDSSIPVGQSVKEGKDEKSPSVTAQEEFKLEIDDPTSISVLLANKVETEIDDTNASCTSLAQSGNDSEYETPKAKKAKRTLVKKQKYSRKKSTKRTSSDNRSLKYEIVSDVGEETDDEDKDETYELIIDESKQEYDDTSDQTDDAFSENMKLEKATIKKKRGRPKASVKSPKKKRKGRIPKKAAEKQEPVPSLHDYKCYICNSESLGSRKAMIEHFSVHMDKVPHTCKECVMETVVLTRVRTLNTHMKMHAQPVKCDYCDRRYSNAAGKYYHTQTFHLGGGAPCLVNCEICGKTCGSQTALKQHMKYHTTKLKCGKCDMVFNHPNKRRNHERLHDENRGYECVVCKKVLQTIESYDVHLKKHSQERSYQCHLCPKKFNTSCNLILHLKVHAKNDNYKPAKSWIEHYTVLSRQPMHFKCNHCDRYNTDKVNNMISHLQAHFKEYECDQCQHKFATAKQLRAHYTTHTGEKPEKCKYCEKVFSTKNNLRIHLKASHPEWVPHRQQQASMAEVQPEPIDTSQAQPQSTGGSPHSTVYENSTVATTTFNNLNETPHLVMGGTQQSQHQLQTFSVLRR
ncbi:zinc finger protein 658-like [Topomyia yanbarensis]|uniref:zinc finger protein 658-like n=1 Tax=Topomyia yanbarensis TaxID=2498891 RepID=UPI00273AC083|nr:zinc finger protein 658-like [Topomyia yanbarensis]